MEATSNRLRAQRDSRESAKSIEDLEHRINNDPRIAGTVLVIGTPNAKVARVMSVHADRLRLAFQHAQNLAPTQLDPIEGTEFVVRFGGRSIWTQSGWQEM